MDRTRKSTRRESRIEENSRYKEGIQQYRTRPEYQRKFYIEGMGAKRGTARQKISQGKEPRDHDTMTHVPEF